MTLSLLPHPLPISIYQFGEQKLRLGQEGLPRSRARRRALQPASLSHGLLCPALSPDLIFTGQESRRSPGTAKFTGVGSPQLNPKQSEDVNN